MVHTSASVYLASRADTVGPVSTSLRTTTVAQGPDFQKILGRT